MGGRGVRGGREGGRVRGKEWIGIRGGSGDGWDRGVG